MLVEEENWGFNTTLFFYKIIGKPKRVRLLREEPQHIGWIGVLIKNLESPIFKKCIKTIISIMTM